MPFHGEDPLTRDLSQARATFPRHRRFLLPVNCHSLLPMSRDQDAMDHHSIHHAIHSSIHDSILLSWSCCRCLDRGCLTTIHFATTDRCPANHLSVPRK